MKFSLSCLGLTLAMAPLVAGQEREPSLAERAEKARKKASDRGASAKVLTNKDLRNAKGNVIFLEASPVPPAATGEAGLAPAPEAQDPASIREAIREASERAARYRGAIEGAELELRSGGSGLPAERRVALERFLEDGRKELARAEQAVKDLTARLPGDVTRP